MLFQCVRCDMSQVEPVKLKFLPCSSVWPSNCTMQRKTCQRTNYHDTNNSARYLLLQLKTLWLRDTHPANISIYMCICAPVSMYVYAE